jgi:hypothetical protein
MKIVETQAEIDLNDHGDIYVRAENIKVWQGADSIRVTDLTNALATGTECRYVSIRNWKDSCGAVNHVRGRYREQLDEHTEDAQDGTLEIYTGTEPGRRTFSPFAVDRVKPLKAKPGKWTIPHVIRCLLNGQYEGLKCNGVYTDDYAWDAAVDFKRGAIADAVEFCRDIIKSPSGWWVSEREGIVHICCHSFDSNEFKAVI